MVLFQTKDFAEFWNQISGSEGQTYKRYVLRPEMLRLSGPLKGKAVLDLGCGNGYMGPIFLRKGAKRVVLTDISDLNLEHAKKLNESKKTELVRQDATKRWKFRSGEFDVIYSDMMLNEIENIRTPIREAFRTLKKKGRFVAAVTHPAWDLFEYSAQKATGRPSGILKGVGNYFFRGFTKFLMGSESLKPKSGSEYPQTFELEHYQRPISDYFNELISAGFKVETISEPPLNSEILDAFPGYRELADTPIGLIFVATK